MTLFDQLKLMVEHGLHTNVSQFANMMLSASENNPEFLNYSAKYQTYVYYGDALYELKEFKKSESIYRKALQLKKSLLKTKGKSQPFPLGEVTSEVDVKYKAHLCLVNVKQFSQAIALLEGIPLKQRTPRVHMALGRLHQQNGADRPAQQAYREVLRECPFAVDAARALLSLGAKGTEVAALMHAPPSLTLASVDWLSGWVKGEAYLHSREFPQAISTFQQLDARSPLRDNTDVLLSLGEAQYYHGDFPAAIATLDRAHCLDPLLVKGMDMYAALLAKEKKVKELESLTGRLISVSESVPEPWIAMGYFCFTVKKGTKAIQFAQKACVLSPRHAEALLLKGTILLEAGKPAEAMTHFGEAYRVAPFRYEAHKGLVDCYVALRRTREAVAVAAAACKQLDNSARALTLYASVMTKDPMSVDKAKSLLERALRADPTHLAAVYLLAALYEQESQHEKGIQLLRRHLENQSSCRLHQMLGDFLSRTNEHEKALHHFSIALNLDPTNVQAAEGSERVESSHRPGDDSSFEPPSDFVSFNEELDESETEAASWSDVDYS